ncbi:MAG: hypothetical protein QOG64_1867 [Acidimicrobiaceae bacterium]|nr:hypothetical protein [Acidimicrobiaceae bacterium]
MALFVIGLIGLATVDGDSRDSRRVRSASAPSATASGAEPGASVPAGAPAAPSPSVGVAPTAAPPRAGSPGASPGTSAPPAAPAGPAAVPPPAAPAAVAKPPRPGSYRYTGQGNDTGDPGGFTVKVEADGEGGGVTHQVISIPQSGGNFRNNAAWSNKQLSFERSELTQGGASYSCQWQPATTEYAFPLSVGRTWSMDSTCSASAVGQAFSIRRVERSEVKGIAAVAVGGTSVTTWVIERTSTVTITTVNGKDTNQSTTTEQFAPDRGLFVHRHIDSTETGPDGKPQPASTDVSLQSLDPA